MDLFILLLRFAYRLGGRGATGLAERGGLPGQVPVVFEGFKAKIIPRHTHRDFIGSMEISTLKREL